MSLAKWYPDVGVGGLNVSVPSNKVEFYRSGN